MTFSLFALNINTTQEHKTELSTRAAVYQTLKECKNPEIWPIIQMQYQTVKANGTYETEDRVLIKRFEENLTELIHSSKKQVVSYEVIEADWKTGILSVEVTNQYQNLGLKKTVKVRKTVIYDATDNVS